MNLEIRYTIKFKDRSYEVTQEEARLLYNELKNHFEPQSINFPYIKTYPIPSTPFYNPFTVTCMGEAKA